MSEPVVPPEVTPEVPPEVTAVQAVEEGDNWQRLSPLTIAAQLVRTLANLAIPLGFVLYSMANEGELGRIGFALLGTVPLLVIAVIVGLITLSWYRQRYRVGSTDVRYEQGLISRSARSVPFERIQDVSLEQKLIPRLLGLVEVRFETGAGGKDELKLDFVTAAQGERLRETVRARGEAVPARSEAAADLADKEQLAAETGQTLFAMDEKRLITFGLFEFSLVVFAVLFGAVQQFEFLLPFEVYDFTSWMDQLEGRGVSLSGLDNLARIGGLLALLGTVIVLGMVTGVVRTILRDFGFRLEQTAKGFRRRRGLLTRTDVVMPVHRVQAVKVSTGWLRRRWGWHGLSVISLAQDAGSSNHDVAPFAQMDELRPIVSAADFALPAADIQWHRPSSAYYTDRAIFAALLPAIAAIVAIVMGYVLAGLGVAALGMVLVLRQFYLWHHDRHALDAAQVISRRGWLAPRLMIASRVKLHSAEIAQGPIARWRGYANLNFGLAGGRLAFAGLPLEEAQALRAAVLDSIAAVDFANLPR